MNDNVFVTQPYLPSLTEFIPYLEKIWQNKMLTNGGPFHQQFEAALCDYLGVDHVALVTNATIALIVALQALNIKNEVLTTPYSFVATSHSLLWSNLKPVFVDIDRDTLNIDPTKIEAAITPYTTAIMPVHCYGYPCDTKEIHNIANKHGLKVIYDAAHAFSVKDSGGSILRHGDLSILSFHATKVLNTFEGGAIICPDAETKSRIDQLKNFGFASEVDVVALGINGKMSEFNAALGLLQLKHVESTISQRKQIDQIYRERLRHIKGIRCLNKPNGIIGNYSYFPIFVEDSYLITRDELYKKLKMNGIHSRRYFYPLISDFSMYCHLPSAQIDNLPVAALAAKQVLCLPIYPDLDISKVHKIIDFIEDFGGMNQ
ncbi:MAG: aminotransferase [Legionella sp.]|nr:MAG: aminotransferase [Legionella sp.]